MNTIQQLRASLERLRELTKEWSDYGTLGETDEDREFEQKWQDALTLLDRLEAEQDPHMLHIKWQAASEQDAETFIDWLCSVMPQEACAGTNGGGRGSLSILRTELSAQQSKDDPKD